MCDKIVYEIGHDLVHNVKGFPRERICLEVFILMIRIPFSFLSIHSINFHAFRLVETHDCHSAVAVVVIRMCIVH